MTDDFLGNDLIFLISAPRSGSTLLQTLLSQNSSVYSDLESWFLLHPAYAMAESGIHTDYRHDRARKLFVYALGERERARDLHLKLIRAWARDVYSALMSRRSEKYYLDKSPPYTRILPLLFQAFPQAKFILLIRNPLSLLHSAIHTWLDGKLENLYWCNYDLVGALRHIEEARCSPPPHYREVRYEDLVERPNAVLEELYDFLEIDKSELRTRYHRSLADLPEDLKGFAGDPRELGENSEPKSSYKDKWKELSETPQLSAFAHAYLGTLGPKLVNSLGYEYEHLYRRARFKDAVSEGNVEDKIKLSWEAAITDKTKRSRSQRLEVSRYRYMMESGRAKGTIKFWLENWPDIVREGLKIG